MATRVGIPRCLLYYNFFPGWREFFTQLGAEVIVSPPTNKLILDLGVKQAVNEICLPFKLFFGHVEVLKSQVDFLFIPRIVSIEKREWVCPKFLGLPDMVKALTKDLPSMIQPDVNLRKKKWDLYYVALRAAEPFTKSRLKVAKALYLALQEQRNYELKLQSGLSPLEVLEGRKFPVTGEDHVKILLLGHPYLIYESYITLDLFSRFRQMGANLITPEMVLPHLIKKGAATQSKDLFWTLNKKVLGTAYHYLEENSVDGIVQVAAFGCGPDSLINELIERRARREESVPLLSINVDEHSGETGLVTRLEAFMDMIRLRRKKK